MLASTQSKKQIKRCPTCCAKMVEYPHSLNKNLVKFLFVLVENGGTVAFKQMDKLIGYNLRANFPKLQYWGLIKKVRDDLTGERKGGLWAITELGRDFIQGNIDINKKVWTYRNEFVSFDGVLVGVKKLGYEPFRTRDDYVADERPRYIAKDGQLRFFG
jgi:hypothetical protein